MKITNKGVCEGMQKVILLAEKYALSELNNREKQYCDRFLAGKADLEVIHELEGSLYLLRTSKDAETMRKRGADLFGKLDKTTKKICLIGKGDRFSLLEGFLLASYKFDKYLAKKDPLSLEEIDAGKGFSKEEIKSLQNIKEAVFWVRDMVNEPVSYLNAEQFSNEISALKNQADLAVHVLEKTQIESLKMGGLLAVNKGSIDPPTFTIIEYKPKKAVNKKPIVLVGKGVVYDTGGLSLKPTPNSMDLMKTDMAGGASVAGAIYLTALEKIPVHVIGLIPATDNRPGLNAYTPGDVITMFNGSTVEVLNTDAEGRMILADALSYADKYKPELIIDAATLTGAAQRALGEHAAIHMGNAPEKYFKMLEKAGEEVAERLVRFPFWDEYFDDMKSTIADMKNIGGPSAGMITAGKFLEKFTHSPYIHIDIAGPAWLTKKNAYRSQGASGYGTRLLYQFLKDLSNGK